MRKRNRGEIDDGHDPEKDCKEYGVLGKYTVKEYNHMGYLRSRPDNERTQLPEHESHCS